MRSGSLQGYRKNGLIHGSYNMYWKVDENAGEIHLVLVAKTLGWMGFGLSEHGSMPGSDMVVAWVDSNGKVHAEDRWANGHTKPTLDDCQDWQALQGVQKNGFTTIHLKRKLKTGDDHQDRAIVKSEHLFVVYAVGKTDVFEGHLPGRMGYQKMFLYGPSDPHIFKGMRNLEPDATPVVLATSFHLPNDETRITCTAYDLMHMKGKYLIGIDPVVR